jgi:hypothetical protein
VDRRAQDHNDKRPILDKALATQGIRGETNRTVLERIKSAGDIFSAWSDRDWILDGANVHVSIICFDAGTEQQRILDGREVAEIHANLASGIAITEARRLRENNDISFSGTKKGGDFDLSVDAARLLLTEPSNPDASQNRDVLRPWLNGMGITRRWDGKWIIDFGADRTLAHASLYSAPFEHVLKHVKPERDQNKRDIRRTRWWLHSEVCPAMRAALKPLHRWPAISRIAKHRIFVWFPSEFLPDDGVYVFARSDDYFFGILQSSPHVFWSLKMGTQLEDRPRYTATTGFETFSLPWPPGSEPDTPNFAGNSKLKTQHVTLQSRISIAAKTLNDQRERWLNPPEWLDPIAARIDETDDFSDVPAEARPLLRHSAIMAAAAKDPRLKKRTLTNLYNERPTWLKVAHLELDKAVLAAYAATDPAGNWAEDWADVWFDTGAGQPLPSNHPLTSKRAEVDKKVLENLLRLNLSRSSQT